MARRRFKVLVVNGDSEAALTLHRVLYSGNQRFDVLAASSAEIAREIVLDMGIDVLVSDADLPGMSGVDFVGWAAVEFPDMLFVVLTGQDVQRVQEKIKGLGCLRLVRKPYEPRDVLKIVHEALDCRHRLSGSFAALSAADLIQMLCLAQRTSSLQITAHGVQGTVVVKDGKLVHAAWGGRVGQDALREIIGAEDGVFRTAPLPGEIATTITSDWQFALMEAVRSLDERAHGKLRQSGSFPAIRVDDSPFESGPDAPEAQEATLSRAPGSRGAGRLMPRSPGAASSLVDKGFAALRSGNMDEARECWLAAKQLDPENRSLDLNLKRLEKKASH
jgi:DNA-binding response OmpR family regulator